MEMEPVLAYRGRQVSSADVAFIRELIATHPQASRRALSLKLCEAWAWMQENGAPRDMVCRGLLLELERAGHIALPPSRWEGRERPVYRRKPPSVDVPSEPLQAPLSAIGPVQIQQVRRTADEALVNALCQQHHYLGYVRPVGEHLKYLVSAQGRPLGCFLWSSAPRHLGPRDRHIGWSKEARRANIRFIAYQVRFLILPWVRVPHLASHLLGRMARLLPSEWERFYGHPVYFAETFTDPARFRGTCYRAANWSWLGQTTGRGKADLEHRPNRPLKEVWGYPLVRDFRERLARLP
jgi:hypothetical protein